MLATNTTEQQEILKQLLQAGQNAPAVIGEMQHQINTYIARTAELAVQVSSAERRCTAAEEQIKNLTATLEAERQLRGDIEAKLKALENPHIPESVSPAEQAA